MPRVEIFMNIHYKKKPNRIVHLLCLSSPIFTLKWQEQSSQRRWLHITWSQNAFPSLEQIRSPR